MFEDVMQFLNDRFVLWQEAAMKLFFKHAEFDRITKELYAKKGSKFCL